MFERQFAIAMYVYYWRTIIRLCFVLHCGYPESRLVDADLELLQQRQRGAAEPDCARKYGDVAVVEEGLFQPLEIAVGPSEYVHFLLARN